MRTMTMLSDRVCVELDKRETEAGGIVLADAYQKASKWGMVTAAGPECVTLKKGSRVYVQPHVGTAFTGDGREYVILREDQVLCMEDGQ